MSPHAQQSFVNDLVAMARAFEELPIVREELSRVNDQLIAALNTVQRLELKAIDRNTEIDALLSRITALEAARDDAEFRFLEADDRTEKALAFVRSTFGNAGALIQALDPKPIASAASEPKVESESPLPEAGTFTALSGEGGVAPDHGQSSEPVSTVEATVEPMPEGQSEPDPTASPLGGSNVEPAIAPIEGAEKPESVDGPYSGKRYYSHQFYVSFERWLAGGGTEEDYIWRPSAQMIG